MKKRFYMTVVAVMLGMNLMTGCGLIEEETKIRTTILEVEVPGQFYKEETTLEEYLKEKEFVDDEYSKELEYNIQKNNWD